MTTGEKIRERRKQLGMTVDDLAAKLGKNRATIYRYENDMIKMPADLLGPLANALDTTPDDLMEWGNAFVSILERDEKMREVFPYIAEGITIHGDNRKYLLFKIPTRGGEIERDLRATLLSLYHLNLSNQSDKMRTIRVLSELVYSLDTKSQENLLSYAEYLDAQCQKRTGNTITHPYQRE